MRDGAIGSSAVSDPSSGPRMSLRAQTEDLLDLPLFDGVELSVAELLVEAFAACQYRAGTLLIESGDCVSKLQIIHRGIVELCRVDQEGHQFGVLLLSAKDVLLPAAAIFEERSLICARTLTTTRMLEIEADLVRSAMKRSAALTFNMMKVTSGQWRMAVRNILELTGRTAAERVGAFLLRLADLQDGAASPVLPIPKRSLASRLGIYAGNPVPQPADRCRPRPAPPRPRDRRSRPGTDQGILRPRSLPGPQRAPAQRLRDLSSDLVLTDAGGPPVARCRFAAGTAGRQLASWRAWGRHAVLQ